LRAAPAPPFFLFEVDQPIAPGRQRFDQPRCVRRAIVADDDFDVLLGLAEDG
jgi:hypothetical protein